MNSNHSVRLLWIVTFLLIQISANAQCESCDIASSLVNKVNLMDGNFTVSYVDMEYKYGARSFKVERTYNSVASKSGIFGIGWAFEPVEFGYALPDGNYIVYSWGNGAILYFYPVVPNATKKADAVELIYSKLIQEPMEPLELAGLKNRLNTDYNFFVSSWIKLLRDHKVEPVKVTIGTKLTSESQFGAKTLIKTQDGYYLEERRNGEIKNYDGLGRIKSWEYGNGDKLYVSIDSLNRLTGLSNNRNDAKLNFYYTGTRRMVDSIVRSVNGITEGSSAYKYGLVGGKLTGLAEAMGEDKQIYRYSYDSSMNMVAIDYSDGKSLRLSYYGLNYHFAARSIKYPNEYSCEMEYEKFARNGLDSFFAKVRYLNPAGKLDSVKTIMMYKGQDNGMLYTSKIRLRKNEEPETDYYLNSNFVWKKVSGNDSLITRRNSKGQIILRETGRTVTNYSYDQCGRIWKISQVSKLGEDADSIMTVRNANCVPKTITWNEGSYQLNYNESGNIKSINYPSFSLEFEYSSAGISAITGFIYQGNRVPFEYKSTPQGPELDPTLKNYKTNYEVIQQIKRMLGAAGQTMSWRELNFPTSFIHVLAN